MKSAPYPQRLKYLAAAVATACITMSLPASAADDVKNLLDFMLKKGVITQKDYDEYLKSDAYENEQFKAKRVDDDVSKSVKYLQKVAKDGTVKENGFGFKSNDGNSEINLTGRLHFDGRMLGSEHGEYSDRDSGSLSDRFSARRVRLGVTGILHKNINYEIVTNLLGSSPNLLDTAWANYTTSSPEFQIRVGRFKQPYGLETLSSSNNISFMERSYQDQIAPGKQLGLMLHGVKPNSTTYAASFYQAGFDPSSSDNGLGPEAAVRFTHNFAKTLAGVGDDVVLHFGVAGLRGEYDVTPTTSSQDGNNRVTRGAFVAFNDEFGGLRNVYRNRIHGMPNCTSYAPATGACTYGGFSLAASDAAKVGRTFGGLELALAKGPTKLQAEYTHANFDAKSNAVTSAGATYATKSSGNVKIMYVELMHNLTGESWSGVYSNGTIGGIRPNSNFNLADGSGTGAWQLGLRLSEYDASDFGLNTSTSGGATSVSAGGNPLYQIEGSPKGKTITLGLNWILNPNARIMFNYATTKFDYAFTPVDIGTSLSAAKRGDQSHAFMMRAQYNF